MALEPAKGLQQTASEDRDEHEGKAEAETVDEEEERSLLSGSLGGCVGENCAKRRSDTGAPAKGESHAERKRTPDAEPRADLETLLPVEQGNPEGSDQRQRHDDDEDAGHAIEYVTVLLDFR